MASIITSSEGIDSILASVRRVAVLGIKAEDKATQPSYYVPAYAQRAGLEIVPVPVYYPDIQSILGQPVVRLLRDVSPPVDMVNVFRRSEDLVAHVPDFIAAHPRVVWFQQGIRNDAVARQLVDAGIDVVQDRCLLVELQRRGR